VIKASDSDAFKSHDSRSVNDVDYYRPRHRCLEKKARGFTIWPAVARATRFRDSRPKPLAQRSFREADGSGLCLGDSDGGN